MDMQDIEKKMEAEIDEERAEFAKNFLKQKRIQLDYLLKQQEDLDAKVENAENEYDEILSMSVDDVYTKYNCWNITGTMTVTFTDPNIWAELG